MNSSIPRNYRYALPMRATMRGLEGSGRRISLAAIRSHSPARYLNPKTLERFPALAAWAERTGATAMVEIPGTGNGGRILAKMEIENPTGSIRDRDALAMIHAVLDSTGENENGIPHILCRADPDLALSLAVLSAQLEIGCTLVMDAGTPAGLIATLKRHGATIHLADTGPDAARQKAAALHRQHPDWHRPDLQHKAALRQFHIRTTAREIIRQVKALSGGTTPASLIMAPQPREAFGAIATSLRKYAGKIGRELSIIEASVSGIMPPARGSVGTTAIRLSAGQCERTIRDFHARSGLWIGPGTAACLHAARHAAAGLAGHECVVAVLSALAREDEIAALSAAEPLNPLRSAREIAAAAGA